MYKPVTIELELELCQRIYDSLTDAIERLEGKGTKSLQRCANTINNSLMPIHHLHPGDENES